MKARVDLGRPASHCALRVELAACLGALLGLGSASVLVTPALWSLALPLLVWCALRYGRRGTLLAIFCTALAAAASRLLSERGAPPAPGWLQPLLAVGSALSCVWLVTRLFAQQERSVEAEREELQQLRNVVDSSPSVLTAVDLEGRVILWNPAAEALFGWTEQEVLGKSPAVVPIEKRDEFLRACAATRRGEPVAGIPTLRRRRDGAMLPVRLRSAPLRGKAGKVVGTIASFEDMTEFRTLEDERRRLADILEKADVFVGIADTSGRLRYLNEAGRQLLGIDEREGYEHLAIAEVVPESMLGKTFEEIIPTLETRGIWRGEVSFLHRDGHAVPVYQVAMGHYDGARRIAYYSTIAYDLSSRIDLERQLREVEEKLLQAQRMEVVGRLAGGVAHDFNNLVTVMLGASDLALAKLPAEHPVRKEIADVQRVSERAAVLAAQLLAFGRKRKPSSEHVALNDVISGINGILRRVVGEKAKLQIVLGKDVGSVRVDAGQLEQIVMNLAVNGRDAMPGGGTLTIETSNAELSLAGEAEDATTDGAAPTLPQVEDEDLGSYVRLSVRDTGHGMGAQTQTRLFEPFFTTKEVGKGTGLGLATVHSIVEQAGGFVSVHSSRGQGATFHVYLPRADVAPPREDSTVEARVGGTRGEESILVVEGESVVRDLIERVLTERGYRVTALPDADAVSKLDKKDLAAMQLALIDVMLPGRAGLKLAREIRRSAPGMPFVVMSGRFEAASLDVERELAHHWNLTKPFSAEDLARRVRQALDKAASA